VVTSVPSLRDIGRQTAGVVRSVHPRGVHGRAGSHSLTGASHWAGLSECVLPVVLLTGMRLACELLLMPLSSVQWESSVE